MKGSSKNLVVAVVLLILVCLGGTGCAGDMARINEINRINSAKGSPLDKVYQEDLPIRKPNHSSYYSNFGGTRQEWHQEGGYQSVTPVYRQNADGSLSYSNIVTTYNYTNSGSYSGVVYRIPQVVQVRGSSLK